MMGGGPRGGFGGGESRGPRSEDLFSLKVDQMSLRTNKDDIREKFGRFGEIGDIFFPSDKYTGSSRGFCFVRFYKEDSCDDACAYFKDGCDMDGKNCEVSKASLRPRPGNEAWNPDARRGGRDGGRFNDRGGGFRGGNDRAGGRGPNKADDMHSLKVVDMSLRVNKDDIKAKFDRFGEIGDIFFPPDRETGASRGFCYVRYFKRDSQEDAMEYFRDGIELDGRKAFVEKATPRGDFRNNRFNDRGGGFRDRGFNDRGGDRFNNNRGGWRDDRGGDRFDDRRGGDRFDDRRGGDRFDDRRGGDRFDDRRGRSPSPPMKRGGYRSRSRSPAYRRRSRSPSPYRR